MNGAQELLGLDTAWHYAMRRSTVALAAVSEYAVDTLALQFGRRASLIPNAIDARKFHPPPGSASDRAARAEPAPTLGGRVLLVGNPLQASKGWDEALLALLHARRAVPHLSATWICQSEPLLSPAARDVPMRFVVNPAQVNLRRWSWSPSVVRRVCSSDRVHVALSSALLRPRPRGRMTCPGTTAATRAAADTMCCSSPPASRRGACPSSR